jgi:hypothetical protein
MTLTSKKRLNLDLTNTAYTNLFNRALSSDKSMADVLRIGLALVHLENEVKKKGYSLGVIENGEVIKELVIV